MTERAIRVHELTKVYGRGEAATPALRGVDLDVAAGEILFLTGPSGSGKTTLLSILGGVLSPTGGRVEVLGRDVTRLGGRALAAYRRTQIGFVFQGANLIESLDAARNVRVPLSLLGVPRREADARAVDALGRVGLADRLRHRPRELSEGQKQRVAVARAVVTRPPLLLADEPTASLDAHSGQQVIELLVGLARELGHTVVVVTHDARIFPFADRVLAIEDGRLVGEAA